jgi:poly(3-hydroxybutyrate) depolymerase
MVTLLAAAGQASVALAPGDHEFSLSHGGMRRSYLVHVPPQASAGKPLPAVLKTAYRLRRPFASG